MGMFEDTELGEMLKRIIELDEDEIFIEASDQEVLDHIENLNRRQLIQGKGSDGFMLYETGGEYTDNTMEIAAMNGRPKDSKMIVNLFDEGNFHNSIQASVDKDGYTITSDPIKRDPLSGITTNLLDRYGPEVEGLTDENIDELVDKKLFDKYAAVIEKKIFG